MSPFQDWRHYLFFQELSLRKVQDWCFQGHSWPQTCVTLNYVAFIYPLGCPYSPPLTPSSHSNSPTSNLLDTLHQTIWSFDFSTFPNSRKSTSVSLLPYPVLMLKESYFSHQ